MHSREKKKSLFDTFRAYLLLNVTLKFVMLARNLNTRCSFILSLVKGGRTRFSFSTINADSKVFALEYTYVAGMAEKRVPVRPAHLDFTKPYVENGTLIAGGALVPEMENGLLLLRGTKETVETFAKSDPYVVKGLVTNYRIREWAVAVGQV